MGRVVGWKKFTNSEATPHIHFPERFRTGSALLPWRLISRRAVLGVVPANTVVSATFSEAMNPATINMVTAPLSPQNSAIKGCYRCIASGRECTPAGAKMVPTIVPSSAPLSVAALSTCQNTFLACAPLIRMTLRGNPGASIVSEFAI